MKVHRVSNARAVRAALVGALIGGMGCSSLDNCPDSQAPRAVTGGKTDTTALTYDSAPWDELTEFPAKTELWFKHGLGVTPLEVKVYLSFSAHGTNGKDAGSVSESAGNQALFDCIDSNVIVVRNDTCEKSFYIRVIAEGASSWDQGDACGEMP